MRKLIIIIMITMLMLCGTVSAWAQNDALSSESVAKYSDIFKIFTVFSISAEGLCNIDIDVTKQATSSVDNVKGTVQIVNTKTGQIPVTWSKANFRYSLAGNCYSFNRSYNLTVSGEYMIVAKIYLYDEDVLKETTTVTSYPDSF